LWAARVTAVEWPAAVPAGALFPVALGVENLSAVPWFPRAEAPGLFATGVEIAWRSPANQLAAAEPERLWIGRRILPGKKATLRGSLRAPRIAGDWQVQFAIVIDGVGRSSAALAGPPLKVRTETN
jgi:hypothetical protein